VDEISNTVGENPEATRSALSTALPALLGALIGKATASPNGANELFNVVKQGENQPGGWTSSVGDAIANFGGPTTPTAPVAPGTPSASHSLLNSLLGSKLGPVADFIATKCGIRGS